MFVLERAFSIEHTQEKMSMMKAWKYNMMKRKKKKERRIGSRIENCTPVCAVITLE